MPKSKRKQDVITLVVVFVGVVLVSAVVVYLIGGARRVTPETVKQSPQPDAVLSVPDQRSAPTVQTAGDETFIDRLFGSQHSGAYLSGATWAETMGRISLRLALAALLGAALAELRQL